LNEYPIFVPHDGEHLAAIICVPDHQPKSLVLCIQGLGAPRSHRYGLWTWTARRLADHGIASIRFDYPQVGDSTGTFEAELDSPPVAEARSVVDLARKVLGVEKYGVIGNCLGLLAGYELAMQDADCISLVCLLKDPPKEVLVDRTTPTYQKRAQKLSRRVPRARRFVRRFVHVKKGSFRQGLTPQVAETLRSTDVLFLLTGKASTGERLSKRVAAVHRELQKKGSAGRAEVKTIEVLGTEQFQLPMTTHPQVIDAFVEWMTRTLPSGGQDGSLHSPVVAGNDSSSPVPGPREEVEVDV
jgi:pimeloyl-ACP methyl ester carboxylesterase